mgnify:CR=1 FL=1
MTGRIKPSGRRGGITNELWWEVVMRDARFLHRMVGSTQSFDRWFRQQERICLAPVLDPSLSGTCSGRTTVDHVRSQPGGQRRHEVAFLVSGCMEHNVWRPPSRELRAAHRTYLASLYPWQWRRADDEDSGRA